MYCHAMATFALSELYVLTHDGQLEDPVRNAVRYSLTVQHPITGGWRYQAGDPGDTSQLGWQVMALKSAQLAGVRVPEKRWLRINHFLRSVSGGQYAGLASYRPGGALTRAMTAEAFACRQLLGVAQDRRADEEAAHYMLGELPGKKRANFYYWYYATLAMHQLQGEPWHRWNKALKETLLDSQRTWGHEAGSWDPSTVWGGYGGRVYCTAMAALMLEVYYRYLPMYEEATRQGATRFK